MLHVVAPVRKRAGPVPPRAAQRQTAFDSDCGAQTLNPTSKRKVCVTGSAAKRTAGFGAPRPRPPPGGRRRRPLCGLPRAGAGASHRRRFGGLSARPGPCASSRAGAAGLPSTPSTPGARENWLTSLSPPATRMPRRFCLRPARGRGVCLRRAQRRRVPGPQGSF
jgi:hypothetical protein